MRREHCRWVAVICGVMVAPMVWTSTPFAGQTWLPTQPPMDFILNPADGREFRHSQQWDKMVDLSVCYPFCPDVCPTTLAVFSQGRARLEAAAMRVQVV